VGKKFVLNNAVFPVTYFIQLGGNPKWMIKKLGDIDYKLDKSYRESIDGICVALEGRVGIWVKNPKDGGTIMHEVLHGVKHNVMHLAIDDEECECYLIGWITTELGLTIPD
jgi:hypothetical protein